MDIRADPQPRSAIALARALALVLGALNAWSSRHVVNPGGVSHLDMAEAIVRDGWAGAVNGYFSPLYSIVIAPVVPLTRAHPYLEASAVHAVHFLIYVLALLSFERFLRAVVERARNEGNSMPASAWVWFGYASFAWTALFSNSLVQMTGDLLVAALAYGAGAILVRMEGRPGSLRDGLALGVLLGLGFLAKTAMLPLSLLFLASALASRAGWRANGRAVGAASVALLCVSLPFIVALSIQKGRPTAGDIGKLAYAWFVLDVPRYAHWQGEEPAYGVPLHPDRKLHASPDVFEYATPVGGTLPVFYDPTYWYEGLEVPIRPGPIVHAIAAGVQVYWRMALEASAELLAVGVLLFWMGWPEGWRRLGRAWRPLLPVLAVFPMYALVHAEPRFVGGFATMALLLALSCVRVPEAVPARRLALALLLGASLVMALRSTVTTASNLERGFLPHRHHELAVALQSAGAKAGDWVAVVGAPFDAYWARLAGVRIVADVADHDVERFWHADPRTRDTVFAKLRSVGVRHLVAFAVPPGAPAAGWQPLGATGAFVHTLRPTGD